MDDDILITTDPNGGTAAMTANRFEALLQTLPPERTPNRFADLLDQVDDTDARRDVDREVTQTLELAQTLEMPVGMIEDHYPEISAELTVFDRPADPSDVPRSPSTRTTSTTPFDNRIGLAEQIRRMDAGDWLSRVPLSPVRILQTVKLMEAVHRLKKDPYEKEAAAFAAHYVPGGRIIQRKIVSGRVVGLEGVDVPPPPTAEAIRARDLQIVESFLLKQQEKAERGQTLAAKVFDGASYLPAWMIEFALTGGLAKVGNSTAREIGLKTLQGYAKNTGGRAALAAAGWTGGAITRASLGMPHRVADEILERRIPSITIGPDNELNIAVTPESWATSVAKGWGSVAISVAAESTGEGITAAGKAISRATLGRLPFGKRFYEGLQHYWLAMHPGQTADAFASPFFTQTGYSNLLGEMGEERLDTILQAIFGTEDFGLGPDASAFDRLKAGLAADLQNLPAEAITLAIPGAVKAAVTVGARGIETLTERDEHDVYDLLADVAALDATQAAKTYLGVADDPDLTTAEPTASETGFLKQLLHDWGIKSIDGYEPFSQKDFHEIFKYLQMPDDIRRSFTQFDGVYQIQRGREIQKQVLDQTLADMTKPYFGLTADEYKAVDQAFIEAERNPDAPAFTAGLSARQKNAFTAIRQGLSYCADLLMEEMRDAGVDEKTIKDFARTLRNYVPHKWYGSYAVVVKDPLTQADRAHGITKRQTLFMTAVPFKDRFTERTRLQTLWPGKNVYITKRNQIEYEAFQDAPPWAVSRMVDLIIEKAKGRLSGHASDVLGETISDLYKSKGFGMHYIHRRNIPGYSEDLYRPLAEYFTGFAGYITKLHAMKMFPEALKQIHPERTPKLYKYALDYIRYVTGDPMEFSTLKRVLYAGYLYGNIKSASLNLTQNLMLGWPVLSKRTQWPLARLLTAAARTVTGRLTADEKGFLNDLQKEGYLDPQMAQEISGHAGHPIYAQLRGKTGKALSYGDLFKHMEGFNRRAMAIALYQTGVRKTNEAAQIIDEAHFRYSKGNRPTLSRGLTSPLMVFRSWNINYLTWLKNEIKDGRVAPLARSLTAWILLGGIRALPGMSILLALYAKIFQRDLEGDARDAMGETAAQILFRGLPSEVNISFTGSVGMGDLIPIDLTSLGGVAAGIPDRVTRVLTDLHTGQYARALEDASPEVLRNPLSARRLYTQGARTRSGQVILDLDSGRQLQLTETEAILKSLGFAPDRLRKEWDIRESLEQIYTQRQRLKTNWADRIVLAIASDDTDEINTVREEIDRHTQTMKARGRDDLAIAIEELERAVNSRLRPLNIPAQSEWATEARIRGQYRKRESQPAAPLDREQDRP